MRPNKGALILGLVKSLGLSRKRQRQVRFTVLVLILAVVAFNEILVPYLSKLGTTVPTLELSPEAWSLLYALLGIPEKKEKGDGEKE